MVTFIYAAIFYLSPKGPAAVGKAKAAFIPRKRYCTAKSYMHSNTVQRWKLYIKIKEAQALLLITKIVMNRQQGKQQRGGLCEAEDA